MRRGQAEKTAHPRQKRSTGDRHGKGRPCAAELLEIGERARVRDAIAAELDREIVAAVLALNPDSVREPPDRRVIEEQRFDDRLQQVDEVVVPPHVGQFVRDHRLELRGRQPGKRARRQQNHRTKPTDDRRHVDDRGFQCTHRARDAQLARHFGDSRSQRRRDRARAATPQTFDNEPSRGEPRRQQRHAGDPDENRRGQPCFDVDARRNGDRRRGGRLVRPRRNRLDPRRRLSNRDRR